MKKSVRIFLVLCIVAVAACLAQRFLFPLVYRVKEPFFIMPVQVEKKVVAPEDLPIRNDEYGDGWFGAKRRGGRKHKGLDLAAKMRSPVYAAKSGWAEWRSVQGGYGNLVVIDHPGGWQTRYGHLAEKNTVAGKRWVRQGDVIGLVGKTGNANSSGMIPHLHFEIRFKDEPVDPARELTKKGGRR